MNALASDYQHARWRGEGQASHAPDLSWVEQARLRIAPLTYCTPLITCEPINETLGCDVFWKLECLQKTNAFKVRGALNRVLVIAEAGHPSPLVAASSGNHGIGVAFAARQVHLPATIVMPASAPRIKREFVLRLGAEVLIQGDTYDDALAHATNLASARGTILVPSFDDPWIIAGQGTIALEILDQSVAMSSFDDVIVPIGGGGLAAGIGIVLRSIRPSTRVYGVQAAAAPAAHHSHTLGKRVAILPAPTVADAIRVAQPGALTFPLMKQVVDEILLVEEEAIREATRALFFTLKVLVEPAAAVVYAAVRSHPARFAGRRVVCVLTGANVDPATACTLLWRGYSEETQIVREG